MKTIRIIAVTQFLYVPDVRITWLMPQAAPTLFRLTDDAKMRLIRHYQGFGTVADALITE